MKDNLSKVTQVWGSFVKFIVSQVMTNGKCVDTQLIGLIFKSNHSVGFLPSADYLEAGKFKFRHGTEVFDGMREDNLNGYKKIYDQKLKVSWMQSLMVT